MTIAQPADMKQRTAAFQQEKLEEEKQRREEAERAALKEQRAQAKRASKLARQEEKLAKLAALREEEKLAEEGSSIGGPLAASAAVDQPALLKQAVGLGPGRPVVAKQSGGFGGVFGARPS